MKIDLVGEKNRGFAMGLNEFAGYVARSTSMSNAHMSSEEVAEVVEEK